MIDASSYSIEIRKGNFEGEICFQARVKEIPYLEEYADSYEDAYALVIDSINETAMHMAEKGKAMPEPLAMVEDYSGRVTLRLPRTLHRYLSHCAENEDVSLNSLLVSVLADFRGFDVAHDLSSKDYYQAIAMKYKPLTGPVEHKVTRRSNLRVVASNAYQPANVA